MDVGSRIRKARKSKNLTQIEVAASAKISVNSLRLYEAGKRQPGIDQLKAIARALDEPFVSLALGERGLTKQEVFASMQLDNYLAAMGYEFHLNLDDDLKSWLCVDNNHQKLYLLSGDDAAALEASLHAYTKYQIAEMLGNAKEIPDTGGWFKK